MKTKSGVYQILNTVNGKRYVGSTANLKKRQWSHWVNLRQGINSPYLQNAWDKYGEKSFSFKVLEYVSNPKQLIKREQYYFDTLKPEYNISPTAGNCLGVKRTEEQKQRTSEVNIGNKHTLGYRHTPKALRKMSKASMGNKYGPNQNTKLTEPDVRKIRSLLAKDKLLQQEIGTKFGVSRSTIRDIKLGNTWRCIPHIWDDLWDTWF